WLFFMRFGETNILLSSALTPGSKVLFRRTVRQRLSAIAPFLSLDSDPYIVNAGGKLTWIQDAYTVSDHYPYSYAVDSDTASGNYWRNSVKATLDAYDGTVHFYVADPSDPIIASYQRIFPRMFE